MIERLWSIRALLPYPRQLIEVEPRGQGELLPKQLGTATRLRPEQRELDGTRLALKPSTHPGLKQFESHDPAELVVEITASTALEAVERATPLVELVLDRLAFDLQAPLQVIQTDVHDVTPPVAIGDEREMMIFAGYPFDKFARSEDLGSVVAQSNPTIAASYGDPSSRVRAALRWYVKALGTPFLHDRFIFLWIAAEIFADDSGIEVRAPYKGRCGHHIENCPICNEPTDNKVRGASIRAYLVGRGCDEGLAKTAWELRQMMHGAIPFDSQRLADMPAVVQVLRAQVGAEIKAALGIAADAAPFISAGVASIHPAMAVGGTTKITEGDLSQN